MIQCATVLLALLLAVSASARTQDADVPGTSVSTIELTDFLYEVLPKDGFTGVGWDYLVEHQAISWQTDGTYANSAATWRRGHVKITHLGVTPKVLRKKWENLPWNIGLYTNHNPKFGPSRIELAPSGKNDEPCFGYLYNGCFFITLEYLIIPK